MTDFEGDMEYVALYAGEPCDLVHDVKPAVAIMRDVVREAGELLKKLGGLGPEGPVFSTACRPEPR